MSGKVRGLWIWALMVGWAGLWIYAQGPVSEIEQTSQGPLKITPIYHGSLMLEFNGKVIHIDPWSKGEYSNRPAADIILITDIHSDHMDPEAIKRLKKPGTKIVAPEAVSKTVSDALILRNGERKTVDGVEIEAIPMYNLVRGPSEGQKYHTKGRGNGYVLTLGGKRVYISGDTECVPEVKALKNIDIAFVCMNLPYTMTPEEAAGCITAFGPKIVYPYHYRGSELKALTTALQKEKGIEVRLRKWY